IADPFHLLECSMTSEGVCGLVLTTAARAADTATKPVWILRGAGDTYAPAYVVAPVWDLRGRNDDIPAGYVGRRAARKCFEVAGLGVGAVAGRAVSAPFSVWDITH